MLGDLGSILAVVVALVAFGFSLVTWREQRSKDRRDLFLQIHERLIDPDLQEGRSGLNRRSKFQAQDWAALRASDPDLHRTINRALAMLDVLAMYVEKKYVEEELVCEHWAHTVARTWTNAQTFMDERQQLEGHRPWLALQRFGPRVVDWATVHPR